MKGGHRLFIIKTARIYQYAQDKNLAGGLKVTIVTVALS